MLRIVNHDKGIIICCPFVCGTTFLHLYVNKNEDYEHVRGNWHIPENYNVVRVVRDPIQRFHSWYNKFVLASNVWYQGPSNRFIETKIDENNIEDWFAHFSTVMHYDGHTALQKYSHMSDKRFNIENIKYINSSYLQKFMGTKPENYVDLVYNTPHRNLIDKYLEDLYKIDINWMKELRIYQ